MKRLFGILSIFMLTIFAFGQSTVYYQQIDNKISIGIGKSDRITKLVLLTNSPKLELIVNDRFIKTECRQLDKHNYEHIVIIPNFSLEMIKNNLRNGEVYVNKKEYSALEFGAAIAAAEWYSSYYENGKELPNSFRKYRHRPFIKRH